MNENAVVPRTYVFFPPVFALAEVLPFSFLGSTFGNEDAAHYLSTAIMRSLVGSTLQCNMSVVSSMCPAYAFAIFVAPNFLPHLRPYAVGWNGTTESLQFVLIDLMAPPRSSFRIFPQIRWIQYNAGTRWLTNLERNVVPPPTYFLRPDHQAGVRLNSARGRRLEDFVLLSPYSRPPAFADKTSTKFKIQFHGCELWECQINLTRGPTTLAQLLLSVARQVERFVQERFNGNWHVAAETFWPLDASHGVLTSDNIYIAGVVSVSPGCIMPVLGVAV
ncbi:hypothetical protein FA95DRAFT_1123896 [Auriscalpium vulgare]|uniref:Uncharacterized protein n=1 Tax=Auriscalpium vulgare TaxID=40419 RepID=A0ACB8RW18_9AGAM|nr:hypothetical protein FA95DRAFT_1123896 [Auriscalpium vulgare]